jgi:hypothetical protein
VNGFRDKIGVVQSERKVRPDLPPGNALAEWFLEGVAVLPGHYPASGKGTLAICTIPPHAFGYRVRPPFMTEGCVYFVYSNRR